jgi:hypothetical protein
MKGLIVFWLSAVLAVGQPAAKAADKEPDTAPRAERAAAAEDGEDPPVRRSRFPSCDTRRLSCCAAGIEPCTRPHIARLVLAVTGVASSAIGSAIFLVLGDRLGGGDPAGLMIGGGALSLGGALLGGMASLMGGDRAGHPDRVRPATVDLEYTFARMSNLDEVDPDVMRMRWAPTLAFPNDHGRLRLIGHLGGPVGVTRAVDPRPQHDQDIEGQNGTYPVVLRERRLDLGVGLDLAVKLPYPVRPPERSPALGRAELRFRPEARIRRHVRSLGDREEQIEERVMFLPLTVGARWHISPRQRFTFYVGPRFDFISYSLPGSTSLERGEPQVAPLFGEAFYDIDVPLTERPRRDGQPRQVDANGQLTLGYAHCRFDGMALNIGPAVGFLGPAHVAWHMRFRPRANPVAFQMSLGLWVGSGVATFLSAGIVTPDIRGRKK